jgi:Domain of Unknown Function with PDB structure (DUF3857)/Transglutaminase-like superfamily
MMKPKSFFSRLLLRRTTKRLVFSAVFLASALVWGELHAHADSAPDWLRTAAAQKIGDYDKDTVAVILLDDCQTTVKDNGDIETRHRRAIKLLRPEARDNYGFVRVDFDNQTKITYLKAWTITPDNHELEVKEKDAAEVGLSTFEVFSDDRAKILTFPEANAGSVVGYEYVQKHRPFVFEDDWSFQHIVPVLDARFTLQLPAGWEFSTFWINHPEQRPQELSPNVSTWEVKDVPAVEVEPEMPPWEAIGGRLGLKYFPRDPAMRAKTSGSWTDLGLWYDGLSRGSLAASPDIKKKAADLTSGVADPLGKIQALTQFVQSQIRYAAIEIGIGGLQPHPAADVFAHQYGDCKDKATLLASMLNEIGVSSYLVMIDVDRGVVRPEFPSLDFDHVILAIRLNEKIPTNSLYATINDPKLGTLLIFDPTNPYVPLGYLPSYLQNTYALVATPQGGVLIKTPLLPPATNRLLRTAKLDLSPQGNLTGDVQELRWGGPAAVEREQLLEAPPAKRSQVLEDFIGNFFNGFVLTNATVGNLEKYDESLVLDYKFVAQKYAKSAGDLLIVRPRVIGSEGEIIYGGKDGKPRKYPIEFHEATRQDDIFDITLPAGYVVDELPQPVQAQCDYATYKSEIKVDGSTLHYKRTYEIKDIYVPTEKLPEVRDFFRQVAADERSSAILRRATQ